MFVEFDYLFIAVILIVISFIDEFSLRIVACIVALAICLIKYPKKEKLLAALIVLAYAFLSIKLPFSNIDNARIIQIKNNYYLANNGLVNVIVYSNEELNINDEIVISGEIEEINSYNNFDFSTFESYCVGNNIIGSISDDGFYVKKGHFSIRKIIINSNHDKNNDWINSMLFSSGKLFDNDYSSIFFSSGLHISSFLYLLKQIIQLFKNRKKSSLITNIISIILLFLIGPTYSLIRIVLNNWLNYYIDDKRKSTGILIILLILYRPYYVCSLAFLIPIGLKIINLFAENNDRFSFYFYLVLLQSLFFGSCNLVQILLFEPIKIVSCIFFLISVLACMLPFHINLETLINKFALVLDNLPEIELNGKISILLFAIGIFLLINYFLSKKKIYYLYYLILLFVNCNQSLLSPFYSVTFLDVGQGDCAVITRPFNSKATLIDTGGNKYKDIASDIVIPYLKSNSINEIDVIISHDDYDHCGALENLTEEFNVNEIITEKNAIYKSNDIKFYDLLSDFTYQDNNDNSLTCLLQINKFNFLFTGDISSTAELDLIKKYNNLKVDVLKLAHHGSKYSNSQKFLNTIRPTYGIVSASRNNVYHHPDSSVVERLAEMKIKMLSTAKNGAIKMIVLNNLLFILTSDNQIIIQYK